LTQEIPKGAEVGSWNSKRSARTKKMLLVLNKIDLVPPQNARMWQRYLRRDFACIPFKASTQSQSANLATGATLHKKSMTQNPELVDKMTS